MWNNLSIPYKNLLEAMTGTTILVEAEDGVIMRRSYRMKYILSSHVRLNQFPQSKIMMENNRIRVNTYHRQIQNMVLSYHHQKVTVFAQL